MCVLPLKKEQCSLETILLNFLEQRTKQTSSNRLCSCTGMFHVCKYDNAPVCLWEREWQTWAAFFLIAYFQATWDPSFFRLVLYTHFVPAAHPAHRGPKQRERETWVKMHMTDKDWKINHLSHLRFLLGVLAFDNCEFCCSISACSVLH